MFAIVFEQCSPMPCAKRRGDDQTWRAALRPVTVLDGTRDFIWARAKDLVRSPVIEWHETLPPQEKLDEHAARFLDLLGPNTNTSVSAGSYLRTKVRATQSAGISVH